MYDWELHVYTQSKELTEWKENNPGLSAWKALSQEQNTVIGKKAQNRQKPLIWGLCPAFMLQCVDCIWFSSQCSCNRLLFCYIVQ